MTKKNHATTDSLSEQAHEAVNQIARTAGRAEDRIRRSASGAEARAKEVGQNAKETSEETLHSVTGFVRGNPLISLAMAVGAGALMYAFRRRS